MRIFPKIILTLLIIVSASAAHAHPLGSKLFGQRMIVTLDPEHIKLSYVVEIPTSKLVLMMERFKKKYALNSIGPDEERRFNKEMKLYLEKNLKLTVNGEARPFTRDPNYAPSQGAGDYRFFEYRLHLTADVKDIDKDSFLFSILNQNFRMQPAVFHDEIKYLPGAYDADSNVPEDMGWIKDSKYRLLTATFMRGDAPKPSNHGPALGTLGNAGGTQLLGILKTYELTFTIVMVAIATAIFLGMAHALSPGHGKALVAAYLVGSRGTAWHAMLLGIIVTITHIISIVVLGVASLIAAQYIVPEQYMPFISLGAGLLIVFIGIWLIIKRLRGRREHEHHHIPDPSKQSISWKELFVFGITGGIVPCPTGMVVMLTAIAIGRVAFGLLLIFFFSLGLALVLTIIGILAIRAARLLDRFSHTKFLIRWLPLVSAIIITALGMIIVYQGFYVEWMTWR